MGAAERYRSPPVSDTKIPTFSVRPLWTVTHGPDDSHLIETEVFDTRGAALARFAELRDRRPCKVWRLAWRSPCVAEDCDRREIASSPLRKESTSGRG